jgi:hypothetical protein
MLSSELLCYEKPVSFFFLLVFCYLPQATDADVQRIKKELTKSKLLTSEGWKGFHPKEKLPSNERDAYNLPLANVINGILFATPGTTDMKPKKVRGM